MAKEKTSTRALTGDRILHKEIPSTSFAVGDSPSNGWEANGALLWYETYFDLSGYELDDLTLIPTMSTLQDGMPYFGINTNNAYVFDIISQERLTIGSNFVLYTVTGDYPGSPSSTENWSQIIMCNVRYLSAQTDFSSVSLLLPATAGAYGSAEPTAVQKLWLYRVILPTSDGGGTVQLNVPATRFVLGATIVKEDDLEYMMRLKRSYELSTQE